jgi:phage terminase small subunit
MSGAEQMEDTEPLTHKQALYVQHLASGMDSRQAARAAGFSESFSRVAAYRLGKIPAVVKTLEEIRKKGCELAAYGLSEAMKEAKDDHDLAVTKGQMIAAVRATELRMKLSGLLIDKVQIEAPVDLRGAMEAAKMRVLNILASPSQACLGPVDDNTNTVIGGAHWEPRIAGTQSESNGS